MADSVPKTVQELETPCMLVDIDRVKRNCQMMIDRCQKMGVELRPHMKTHKTIEGGDLMTNGTRRKIVVSTIKEAEFYAENGYDDIMYAYPLVKAKVYKRVIDLANKLEAFHLICSNAEVIDALNATPLTGDKRWSVFVEIDCGDQRTGRVWNSDTILELAKQIVAAEKLEFKGIYVHCGNTYQENVDKKVDLQQKTYERIMEVKNRLEAAGIECKHYGTGSTPSCSVPIEEMSALTEFHPGNYIFYDAMQVWVGSCKEEDIASKIVTTVVDHKPELQTLIVDCGWTAISQDGVKKIFEIQDGMAIVEGHPNLKLEEMTQELGKIKAKDGEIDFSKYPLGTRLCLYPFHSCASAAMHDVYYVHQGDKIVGVWKPTRGW